MLVSQVRQAFILLMFIAAFIECNVMQTNRQSPVHQYLTKLPISSPYHLPEQFTTIGYLSTNVSEQTIFSDSIVEEKFTTDFSPPKVPTTVTSSLTTNLRFRDVLTTKINTITEKTEQTTETPMEITSNPIGQHDETASPSTSVSHEMYMNALRNSDTCIASGRCDVALRNTFLFCRCDDLCVFYNDCCLDSGKIRVHSEYKFTCAKPATYSHFKGFLVIAQCPANMTGSVIDLKCRDKNIVTLGPWVIDKDGLVYQNIFCARCYGKTVINSFSIFITTEYKSTIDLLLNTNITSITNLKYAQIPPKDIDVRGCLIYNTDYEENTDCDNYHINPVYSRGLFHKNQYCVGKTPYVCLGHMDFPETESGAPVYSAYALSCLYFPKQTNEDCLHENDGLCLTGAALQDYVFFIFIGLVAQEPWTWRQMGQILISFMYSLPTELSFKTIMCDKDLNTLIGTVARCHIDIKLKQQMEFKNINRYKKLKWHNVIAGLELASVDAHIGPIPDAYFTGHFLYLTEDSFTSTTFENVTMLTDRLNTTCFDIQTHTEFSDGKLFVNEIRCVSNASIGQNYAQGSFLKIAITYGGMIISVIALIISIIIHRITGMFKSIPGSNVENISVSLLVFNILFLVGVGANDVREVCYTVGVCLQYVWLLVFSFKSVTLVYMCYNLTRVSNTSHSFVQVRKRTSTILGVTLPLPIVMTTVIMDRAGLLGLYAHYGDSVCFPTGYPANIFFVSTPIGLSVLINVICLISICFVIRKQSIATKYIRKTSSYKHFPVFVRISAVTGIFWIVGVFWQFYRYEFIEFLFLITCSFQGLLIAITNLSTKRVLGKLGKSSKPGSS